jgi:hypothetical protein
MTRLRENPVFRRTTRGLIALGSLVSVWLVAGAPFDAGW